MNNAKDKILKKVGVTKAHLNLIFQGKHNASYMLARDLVREVGGKVDTWITGTAQERSFLLELYAQRKKLQLTTRRGRPSKK